MFLFRLASMSMMVVYLGAAFLPCEPPHGPGARWVGTHPDAAHGSVDPSPPMTHAAGPSRGVGSSAAVHHFGGSVGSVGGHASHPSPVIPAAASRASRSGPPPADSTASRAERGPGRAGLVLTAPCLCGCSRTRARVGGGAARLGAVVPGLAVARLLEAPPGEPPLLVLGPVEDAFLPIDPVPI